MLDPSTRRLWRGRAEGVRQLGVPVKLDRTPGEHNHLPGPTLGEHTEDVLRAAEKTAAQL